MSSSVSSIHRRQAYTKNAYTYYPVAIIGAGESGIAMGCRMKEKLGFDQFRIFERQSGIGGTWWINRYPGVACDIPALFYSFSFAPKRDWTTLHPAGPEIQQYLVDVCSKYQIIDKIQLNTDIRQIRWLEDAEEWEITLSHLVSGTGDLSKRDRDEKVASEGPESVYIKTEVIRAKIVVSCLGALVEPQVWPESIPGIDTFAGDLIHTARWDESIDLQGKNVVVIGSGCSAAQVVPKLSEELVGTSSVTQLMRSPPWVIPNELSPEGMVKWEKYSPILMRRIPGLAHVLRNALFFHLESAWFRMFQNNAFARWQRHSIERQYLSNMRHKVPSRYHEILTPNYAMGCKRRVLEGEWFRSLNRPNVELTTLSLTSVQSRSVTLGPGRHYPPSSQTESKIPHDEVKQIPADVIVLANGYQTVLHYMHSLRVIGRENRALQDVWDERGGPQAYLGTAMDGFPNFFMIYGPNTTTGQSSVIYASENMINYSLNFIGPILDGRVSSYEVSELAERKWTSDVQRTLRGTVFGIGGCNSWYKTEEGWNSTTYPYSQIDFFFRCTFPVWQHWTPRYTTKGLRIRRLKRALLTMILGALVWMKTTERGIRAWTGFASFVMKATLSVVEASLLCVRSYLT
ncbi:hypothetical protein ASPZODRAFT_71460 [Penicilliopsis zonata CBS 506.65]|uniref:L-ornithine N(5)-oxygenase n=1 Tax=Penicilliopsis zonata CBS 506.65 TaxID=1073090 RepID=A0A1L9SCG7_9EURO|nr:hypothetical protein ASPZODRAFT_71460 [Penicilliopsis zonata CBS 506.65]OJJ44808.1 hypothetical protein ASPZODRAFT_71460 [Penicilliopsis zonata CBS 506.65]